MGVFLTLFLKPGETSWTAQPWDPISASPCSNLYYTLLPFIWVGFYYFVLLDGTFLSLTLYRIYFILLESLFTHLFSVAITMITNLGSNVSFV